MLARPAHSPYGSSSSAVSGPSARLPRSAARSFTRPRSPTKPWSLRRQAPKGGRGGGRGDPPGGGRAARDAPPLEVSRLLGCDQLAAESPQERMRHGRDADLPEPAEVQRRLVQQRIVQATAEEGSVVVVEREREPHPLDALG